MAKLKDNTVLEFVAGDEDAFKITLEKGTSYPLLVASLVRSFFKQVGTRSIIELHEALTRAAQCQIEQRIKLNPDETIDALMAYAIKNGLEIVTNIERWQDENTTTQ